MIETLELMVVAKWLTGGGTVSQVAARMGVTRAWIDERLRAMSVEVPPRFRAIKTAEQLKTLATKFLELKENGPERTGITLPDGVSDPARWRDALESRLRVMRAPPSLFTTREVSDLMGVPRAQVYVWCVEGSIPGAQKVGREWRFDRQLIQDWALSRKAPQTGDAAPPPPEPDGADVLRGTGASILGGLSTNTLEPTYTLPLPKRHRKRSNHFRLPEDIDNALKLLAKRFECTSTYMICALIAAAAKNELSGKA